MAGEAVASTTPTTSGLSRPKLKGHHAAFMKKHLAIAIALSLAGVVAAKLLINDPRKRAYAKYYAELDCDAEFERMRKLGLFSSCPADD